MESVTVDDEVVCETLAGVSGSVDSAKKETFNVWRFFTKTGKDKEGIEKTGNEHQAFY